MKRLYAFAVVLVGMFFGFSALAHEAYVIDKNVFWEGIRQPFSTWIFKVLSNSSNLKLTAMIATGTIVVMTINLFVRRTKIAKRISGGLEHYSRFGPILLRVTIAAVLFLSAKERVFLGPELLLQAMPWAELVRWALFALSGMVLFGVLTELAGVVGLAIFVLSIWTYGSYMLGYVNYLAEFVVLVVFGMRVFSLDAWLFGKLGKRSVFEKYETTIVRIAYGFGLLYSAITIKLLHSELTLKVVQDYHLTQFHWLFPSDPMLVVLGAGIVEAVIGLFIILGFELRFTVLVSLFYITLSLIYFGEQVWPHLFLYSISLNLLIQPEIFTLDHLLSGKWGKLFNPHVLRGKSF